MVATLMSFPESVLAVTGRGLVHCQLNNHGPTD